MDIRGPRLRKPSDGALGFTSSMAWDGRIAGHVIRVNLAHMVGLVESKEVDRPIGSKCLRFLLGASPEIPADARAEDFHQLLEQEAVDELGVETAGFLNYGKSRNDQVATAIRMELRSQVIGLIAKVLDLQRALLRLADRHGGTLIPGYTHLQRAQPVTLAHHLFAHFDAFQRDSERLFGLYSRVNTSPMGSAAMAGTSVRVDRESLAGLLGFSGPVRNAMDAVSSRDAAVEALSCATITMLDASRLAEELILWSTTEFKLIELDDAFAASSSIMPQKKNAVVAEMVRAKAGSVIGGLTAACAILKALPYSYNLDFQEVTPHLWRAFDDTSASVSLLAAMVASASIGPDAKESVADDNSTAVALANYLVEEHGLSFRQAHAVVGQLVRASVQGSEPLWKVASSKMPSVSAKFGKRVALDPRTAKEVLDPERFLRSIATDGGSNPRFTAGGLKLREKELSFTRSRLSDLESRLAASERRLEARASGIAREVKPRIEH